MVRNHDIRQNLSKEEKEFLENIYWELSPELKKSSFYRLLLLKGGKAVIEEQIKGDTPKEIKRKLLELMRS